MTTPPASKPRARDLGIVLGTMSTGEVNAITDVPGVLVGQVTLIEGDGVRTGVTVVRPHEGELWTDPVYAAYHRLNGNGEVTGAHWLDETGLLMSPIALTNTHSVGAVHEGLVALEMAALPSGQDAWALPVVAETWDGILNDVNGFHVRGHHARQAYAAARGGAVPEGAVGGGTGMISHGFKGGTGTSSRVVSAQAGGYTVGVLVQANHGRRERLCIDGVGVGRRIGADVVPIPDVGVPLDRSIEGAGSIIIVVATDAPLLPTQCARLAQRATFGVARTGGVGENSSGDFAVAFSTGNRGMSPSLIGQSPPVTSRVLTVNNTWMDELFAAVVEATEEAIVNALVAGETMTGARGTAYGLPHDLLRAAMDPR